ncbi:MAG: DUF418 domain-containing protein [Planctomycetes bacterium]|nr:DUF418 domain-containing protein [Planctomycetota bacterium]
MNPHASELTPVDASQRIEVLDIVRGFALFGVLIANLNWWSQSIPLTEEQRAALPTAAIDSWSSAFITFAVDNKFITLFSFLFAVGFHLQLRRGEARGVNALPTYRRRLLILLVLGLVHGFFVWMGDILQFYALLGFGLPLLRRFSSKQLLLGGVLLGVVVPSVAALVAEQAFGFDGKHEAEAERLRAWEGMHGGPLALWSYYAASSWAFYSSGVAVGFLVWIAGRFFFGLWAGRIELLQAPERHRVLTKRLLVWGLGLGVLGNGLHLAHERGLLGAELSWVFELELDLAHGVGILGLSAFYLAAILLLLERPRWAARLRFFAPIGRMALTNYLIHSLLYVFVFCSFGLGWVGEVGSTFCLGFAVVVIALQGRASRWWLARHRYGPAEWAWRYLTYGRRV